MQRQKRPYFENLDSLRAIAFLMVFGWHCLGYIAMSPAINESWIATIFLSQGHLGVNLFFVLSGFLITYLLLIEKEQTGSVHIWHFYLRRVLRIWPVYFLVIITGFFIIPAVQHIPAASAIRAHLPFYLTFTGNFDRINTGFVGIGNDNLGVMWSIAVEEQFYFFWPLAIALLPKRALGFFFSSVIAGSLIFRAFNLDNTTVLYLHTLSVMSDLAAGAWLALAAANNGPLIQWLQQISMKTILIVYAFIFLVLTTYHLWKEAGPVIVVTERLLLAVGFCFVIGEQCFAVNSPFKLRRIRVASAVGIISYGLYCYHLYAIMVVQKANNLIHLEVDNWIILASESVVALSLSILIAWLSYKYFETFFLKFKSKFTISA